MGKLSFVYTCFLDAKKNVTEDSEFKMPRVSCIYLGASIEKENRDKVIAIAKERNIPVKQMKVDRGAYDLHAE